MHKLIFIPITFLSVNAWAKIPVTSKLIDAGTCKTFLKNIATCKASKCILATEENGIQNKYEFELVLEKKLCTFNYSITSAQERAVKSSGGSKRLEKTLRNNLEAFLGSMLSAQPFSYDLDDSCCFSKNPDQKFCSADSAKASYLYLLTTTEGSPLCPEKKPEDYFKHLHPKQKPPGEVASKAEAEPKPEETEGAKEYPPATNSKDPKCQAMMAGVPFCAKSTCTLESPAGDKTTFETAGAKPEEDCPVKISKAKKEEPVLDFDCKVPKQYLPELKNYMEFESLGGKVVMTPCVISKEKDDSAIGCQIKFTDKTILNFPDFGEAKGFCTTNRPPTN
jgi:hypothetical protein